jgi:hypothetical protein
MACRASYNATELYEFAFKGQQIVSVILIENIIYVESLVYYW